MMTYRCDACWCYLDPGEGRYCDECLEQSKRRHDHAEELRRLIDTSDYQYTLCLEV